MNRIEEGEYGDRLGLVQLLAALTLLLLAVATGRAEPPLEYNLPLLLTTADFH